jgi:hypothetical protein
MTTSEDIIYGYAKKAGAKFPECVVAQWCLESGYGKHTSGKNNFFGIKGTPGTTVSTQEWVNGRFVTILDTFKDYETPEACVQDLVNKWYKDYRSFKGVNRAKTRNECAELLQAEGYATDPRYSKKLIDLMDRYLAMSTNMATVIPKVQGNLKRAAFYHKSIPHQDRAWDALEAGLTAKQLDDFLSAFRGPSVASQPPFPLEVPYYYQLDSRTGHGERMCFSSAMAMAIEYLCPECLDGDDDDYLKIVLRYGDTVSSEAQLKAARSLGMKVDFRMNMSESELIAQLDKRIPVPIGVLHRGPITAPTGGGHWVCLTGYDSTHFWCHDPYGRMNIDRGGYIARGPNDGNNVRYTRQGLLRRWLIASKSDGWGMVFN